MESLLSGLAREMVRGAGKLKDDNSPKALKDMLQPFSTKHCK